MFLEISQNSQENPCDRVSFLIKLQASGKKKDSRAQVLSYEFCKISKNIICTEHPQTTASVTLVNVIVIWRENSVGEFCSGVFIFDFGPCICVLNNNDLALVQT